ncbi:MAG: Fe-S cluster assembly protein SufD [Spirochaetia bacterium]
MAAIEPQWMRTLRGQARERFAAMSWPTTMDEEWRRMDVSRLGMEGFAPAPAARAACPREVDAGGGTAGFIKFEAGHATEVALSEELKEKGVRLLPLELALEEFETPLYRLFSEALAETDNRFMAWHYGEWSHGAFLWVPPGLEIKEPFLIDFTERGAGTVSSPHVSVILGEGAHATVVQNITGVGPDAASRILCNAAIDLRLADAAALQYCEVQELGEQSLYFRHGRADVGRDASLRHLDAAFGSRVVKSRMECAMSGRGSEAFLDGVYYCRKDQQMDIRTVQLHRSPQATSRAYYKGAVAGGGRTVFQGLIDVSTGASGTDAYLTNRNLILGDAARSDSIPTLKIGNNDVKCSHGSTTGRLSAEELFYLESRGYAESDAREMLVVGYFEDLLTKAPESFREGALSTIRERLRGAA